MSFTPAFLDELRDRIRISEVVGSKVKLIRRGREHTGLCPFHSERTPSFTVNDDKGFYHCFGCGAHGDAIAFLVEAEGLNFRDAVERLAARAGLPLPTPDPEEARRAERRATLQDANELAAKWFSAQLQGAAGWEAMAYLRRRGLTEDTIRDFRIGFAPPLRTGLAEALAARGVTPALAAEAGLLIQPEDGGAPFDRFRNRVMFPILDNRGRVVAFGGRAMDDAPAKYLNSPETPLFHKGRMLFNLFAARGEARKRSEILVVEGYMDVISLAQAGFPHGVAPLGTALTEEQMQELWRVAPEPVLCFDGDAAGRRAAARAVERALPHLKPGHSLRFALLPEGEDPDDFVKGRGADAFTALIAESRPLSDMLWEILGESHPADTPERRAGLEQAAWSAVSRITDPKVRKFYEADFRNRISALWRPPQDRTDTAPRQARGPYGRGGRNMSWTGPRGGRIDERKLPASAALRETALVRGDDAARSRLREGLLLLCAINHPTLLDSHAEELMGLEIRNRDLDKLRSEIIRIAVSMPDLDSARIRDHVKQQGYGAILDSLDAALAPVWFAQKDAALVDVERGWRHVAGLHQHFLVLERERKRVEDELAQELTDEAFARLQALLKEFEEAEGREANLAGFGVASGRFTAG